MLGTINAKPRSGRMTRTFALKKHLVVGLSAFALSGFVWSAESAQRPDDQTTRQALESAEPGDTAAKRLFADAPDGVDPMVTGPVSQDFREKQRSARCAEAVWPDIPVVCYP